jgi:hypothetical protein
MKKQSKPKYKQPDAMHEALDIPAYKKSPVDDGAEIETSRHEKSESKKKECKHCKKKPCKC